MYYNLIPLMNKVTVSIGQPYFDAVTANGGSLTTNEKTYINTLINLYYTKS